MRARLGLRSAYSLLYGVRRPEELAARAASYGTTALAVTDRDNLYGVHSILEASKAAGLKPIVGAELLESSGSLFAFVRDRPGFSRLCELLTEKKRGGGFDLLAGLREASGDLSLASSSPILLSALAGKVPSLYAAITPRNVGSLSSAKRLGLPLLALDDASFLDSDDWSVHAVLRALSLGKTVGNLAPGETADPAELFLPEADYEKRLSSWPEALKGTEELAAACNFQTIFNGFVFPDYQTGSARDPAEELRARVLEGAEASYGEISDAIMERIDYELEVIGEKGFSPYFLVMDDIVSMASRTCGRGSGAASIVSYALGITNVDPIAQHLYFERFLNRARPDPPDIDVDFAWDERDELIHRVIARFGEDHCARVANHNLFRPRSALRETAKAYGLSEAEVAQVERSRFDLDEGKAPEDPLWAEILAIAGRVEGLPRGLSMHCGGLVITPEPISRYAPIEASAEGYPLVTWEKEGVEAAGLVKIDLLGNRSLAVIRDALANLEEEGVHIDARLWRPADDAATVAALARGDSLGVFYIESPAMRQLQKKTGAGDFAHIVIHSSIIRPAANKFIAEYVKRLKGKPWAPLHPRLAKIFDETYGILCYQEDVSKTAVALAGFSEADADKLRKAISKKAKGAKLSDYEARFFSGCREKGVDEKTIRAVWDMMLSFDGYSFCKPHSASYAMVSFQSAYLRVHHPAAFMAAVLSNGGGYYRPQAYISEARRMGLEVVGPDVNRSRWAYRGEGKALVVGLMAIGKLSRSGVDALLAERKRGGPFRDLCDAARRLSLAREDLVALISSGTFDSIAGGERRTIQARFLLGASGRKLSEPRGQGSLFSEASRPSLLAPAKRKETSSALVIKPERELLEEYETLGFLRALHPLALWAHELAGLGRIKACDLEEHLGEMVELIGWPVTQKEVWTSEGLTMNFVSFEDETALYETVLFPEAYARFRRLLLDQRPLIVRGVVKDDQGAMNVEVQALEEVRKTRKTGNTPHQSDKAVAF